MQLLCKELSEIMERKKSKSAFVLVLMRFTFVLWPELFPSIFTNKAILIIALKKLSPEEPALQNPSPPTGKLSSLSLTAGDLPQRVSMSVA